MSERDPSADLQHLFQLALGYMPPVSLNIVVKLGTPDLLASGPLSIEQLSQKTGINEDRLYRIMRALSSVGVFRETERRAFGHIRTLVDVGGGYGAVVAAILGRYPSMRGILYDLEHVVAGHRRSWLLPVLPDVVR